MLEADGRFAGVAGSGEDVPEGVKLVVFDLEMSGANPQTHEILDVGGVRVGMGPGFPEEESWGARVRPKHIGTGEIGALKVVGYSPKLWKGAIELEEAMAKFVELAEGAVLTGWGIGGDLAFLWEGCRRVGVEWPFARVAVDVQGIARVALDGRGEVDRFNLGHVADRLGIGRMGEHGALADAYAAYDVLVALGKRG